MLLLLFIKTVPSHSETSCLLLWPLSPSTFEIALIIPLTFACYSSEQLGQSLAVSKAWYSVRPMLPHSPLVCSRWFCTKQSICLSLSLDYSLHLCSSASSSTWFTSGVFIAGVTCMTNTLGRSLSLALNSFCFPSVSLMPDAFGHLLM